MTNQSNLTTDKVPAWAGCGFIAPKYMGHILLTRLDRVSLLYAGLLEDEDSTEGDGTWPLRFARPVEWYRMSAEEKQDALFYEWENLTVRRSDWPKLSLEECYELMEHVFKGYKNQQCPDLRTNRSSRGYGQKELKRSAAGYWSPQQGVIALAPSGQNVHVVLHECAHVLATGYGQGSHGEGFKKKLLTLLKRHANFTPAPLPEDKQWVEDAYAEVGKQVLEEYRQRWA